jgi:hypothetical protein
MILDPDGNWIELFRRASIVGSLSWADRVAKSSASPRFDDRTRALLKGLIVG